MTDRVDLISPSGARAEVPISPHHEPVEAWLKRGWQYPRANMIAPEPGLTQISGTPPIPPPSELESGQDDVITDAASL